MYVYTICYASDRLEGLQELQPDADLKSLYDAIAPRRDERHAEVDLCAREAVVEYQPHSSRYTRTCKRRADLFCQWSPRWRELQRQV